MLLASWSNLILSVVVVGALRLETNPLVGPPSWDPTVGALRLETNPLVGPPRLRWDPTAGALRLVANPFVDPPHWDPAFSLLPLTGALRLETSPCADPPCWDPVVETIVPALEPDMDDLQGSRARI